MSIEEVGMHDNMYLTQSEEPNPRRTLQNLIGKINSSASLGAFLGLWNTSESEGSG